MKIALAQQNYHIGNFEANLLKMRSAITRAKQEGADLIVFSELSVCGYPPRDFLEFKDFIRQSYHIIKQLTTEADGIAILVGAPETNPRPNGKDLFNSAWFLEEKKVKTTLQKTCLPTYDVFDEYRYFEPAYEWKVVEFKGKKLAITICEDIWNLGNNPLYRTCPMDELMKQEPDIMINLSASPFDYTHVEDRKAVIRRNVDKYRLPMIYCNAVGSQTEIVFDGGSLVFDAAGNLQKQLPLFQEAFAVVEWNGANGFNEPIVQKADAIATEELNPPQLIPDLCIKEIYEAILLGIRDYFRKMGFSQAILGSSGGIDSAVTLALAGEALGAKNVRALLMPSPYSSSHSVDDAVQLSRNLGNPYDVLSITNIYEALLKELKPLFNELPFNVAEENLQSRTRGNLLMALANKFGYVLLNTSNKSELATGYGTLYGDMAGGLGVLGDCYKMQVYELAKYINRNKEIIPQHILTKPPSAELRPGQKDSDSLPEYAVLDQLLYQYIEQRQGPDEIKALGFDPELVNKVLRMINRNEYKRNQFCPIIRISPKAFGVGRRVPIVGQYLT